MKNMKFFCITTVILLTFSCAPTIVPTPTPGGIVDVETNSLTVEKDGVIITVTSESWKHDPVDVKYTFTPFFITVLNNTTGVITIDEDHVFVFDENKTQYGVVDPKDVDSALTPRYYPPVFFYGGSNYYYHNRWGMGIEIGYPFETYDSEVIPTAFRFGPIAPGARVMGFVYLQKPPPEVKELTFKISPILESEKLITLSFNFRREK